ncbi:MAG TPA: NACHT domain-containing protein [Kofleriaceae bacterium]
MFLKTAIPDSGREIAQYREWLQPAFNAADFGRLYSDLFGHPIAHLVHDRTPLTDLIHETLLDCARQGRPLVQLLARAVRVRASRPQLAGPLAQALGLASLVEVADLLVHDGCPDALRDEVRHAFAETTGARLASYHHDGRAGWIDVLVGLEELPALAGRRPAVIEFLERIADAWHRADPSAASALARWLDQQRTPRGIAAAVDTAAVTTDPVSAWLALGLERHGRVKIVGFREAEISLPLDRVFVPLYMYADRRRRGAGPDRRADQDGLSDGGADISLDDAVARSGDDRPCLALVGDPGAGKTTLLRYLFRRVARGEVTIRVAHLRGLHPVLVRLATVRDDEQVPRGLRAIVARIAAEDGHPEAGPALLARPGQRLLFLLDGLDEVRDEPARERLCAWLNDEIDHWPGCGFIATSRLAAWARTPTLGARFLPVWVRGMRGTVRDDYVRRWFGAVVHHFHGAVDSPAELEARANAKATALLDVLASGDWRSHPQLLEMVANPLMLSTLCLAHYLRHPATRAAGRAVRAHPRPPDRRVDPPAQGWPGAPPRDRAPGAAAARLRDARAGPPRAGQRGGRGARPGAARARPRVARGGADGGALPRPGARRVRRADEPRPGPGRVRASVVPGVPRRLPRRRPRARGRAGRPRRRPALGGGHPARDVAARRVPAVHEPGARSRRRRHSAAAPVLESVEQEQKALVRARQDRPARLGIAILRGGPRDDRPEAAWGELGVRDRGQPDEHGVQAAQVGHRTSDVVKNDAAKQMAEQRGLARTRIADQRQAGPAIAGPRQRLVERDLGTAVTEGPLVAAGVRVRPIASPPRIRMDLQRHEDVVELDRDCGVAEPDDRHAPVLRQPESPPLGDRFIRRHHRRRTQRSPSGAITSRSRILPRESTRPRSQPAPGPPAPTLQKTAYACAARRCRPR